MHIYISHLCLNAEGFFPLLTVREIQNLNIAAWNQYFTLAFHGFNQRSMFNSMAVTCSVYELQKIAYSTLILTFRHAFINNDILTFTPKREPTHRIKMSYLLT